VAAIPYVTGVESDLSSFEWFVLVGLILFLIGAILAITGGGQLESSGAVDRPAQKSNDPSCKFCGAPMNGSTTYCPNCGKSQS
jgi:hypothetical protein